HRAAMCRRWSRWRKRRWPRGNLRAATLARRASEEVRTYPRLRVGLTLLHQNHKIRDHLAVFLAAAVDGDADGERFAAGVAGGALGDAEAAIDVAAAGQHDQAPKAALFQKIGGRAGHVVVPGGHDLVAALLVLFRRLGVRWAMDLGEAFVPVVAVLLEMDVDRAEFFLLLVV